MLLDLSSMSSVRVAGWTTLVETLQLSLMVLGQQTAREACIADVDMELELPRLARLLLVASPSMLGTAKLTWQNPVLF